MAMTPTSSSLQAARERLGGQFRELRLAVGLSGRAFASAAGCQASKVSQVERAVRPASPADVRLWCRVCGASPQRTGELLAEQAAVARLCSRSLSVTSMRSWRQTGQIATTTTTGVATVAHAVIQSVILRPPSMATCSAGTTLLIIGPSGCGRIGTVAAFSNRPPVPYRNRIAEMMHQERSVLPRGDAHLRHVPEPGLGHLPVSGKVVLPARVLLAYPAGIHTSALAGALPGERREVWLNPAGPGRVACQR